MKRMKFERIIIISLIACFLFFTSHKAKANEVTGDEFYGQPVLSVNSLNSTDCDCSSMAGTLNVILDTNCDGDGDINRTNILNDDFTWQAEGFPNGGTWNQSGCDLTLLDNFFNPPLTWTGTYTDGQILGTYSGPFNGCWWGTFDPDLTETCRSAEDMLNDLKVMINSIANNDPDAFKNNASQRANALSKKIDAIIESLAVAYMETDPLVQDELYDKVISKLQNDIQTKMNGCPDNADKNDWIIDCSAQSDLNPLVDDIVEEIADIKNSN